MYLAKDIGPVSYKCALALVHCEDGNDRTLMVSNTSCSMGVMPGDDDEVDEAWAVGRVDSATEANDLLTA
jgi:hypothetical protein